MNDHGEKVIELCNKFGSPESIEKLTKYLLAKMGIANTFELDEFCSITNEVLFLSAKSFKEEVGVNFKTYYVSCVKKRFITKIRDDNALKRKANEVQSIDMNIRLPTGDERKLEEIIRDETCDTEKEAIEEKEGEFFSEKIENVFNSVSDYTRDILVLIGQGYSKNEIVKRFSIDRERYDQLLLRVRRIAA